MLTLTLATVMLKPLAADITFPDQADPVAGRAIVVGGKDATITPCFLCHGLKGAGDSTGAFPRLAGQAAYYLYKQLIDYASGARSNDIMASIARELTEQQMQDVASYYAASTASYFPPPKVAPEVLERGRLIAEKGLEEEPRGEDVQACVFCHGSKGAGNPPNIPYLAGQYAPYIELQLLLWKRNIRQNDPLAIMENIAKRLSERDIRAVALYFETVRPPPPQPTTKINAEARTACKADDIPLHLCVLGGNPKTGRNLIAHYGCTACHPIPGVNTLTGSVGPSLEGFGRRSYIAGRIPNRPAWLTLWLQNPPFIDPKTVMPALGINEVEARHMAAYLYTLR
ncbi:cytochrome c4 [Nitrosococcus wardiae]|nr:c-type cytochrome [Nitrosococcus wardiae]